MVLQNCGRWLLCSAALRLGQWQQRRNRVKVSPSQLLGRDPRVAHGAVLMGSRLEGPFHWSRSLQRHLQGFRTPQISPVACCWPRPSLQAATTDACPLLLLCPAGEHITGATAGHLPAKRPIAEESAGGPPGGRRRGPDVSVAVVALSSSPPPLLAAPLPLPHHTHRVFHSALDPSLTACSAEPSRPTCCPCSVSLNQRGPRCTISPRRRGGFFFFFPLHL